MTPIFKTIQDREADPIGLLPWMYAHKPGQVFVVEYKKAGQVVRTKKWRLVQPRNPDELRRWEPLRF